MKRYLISTIGILVVLAAAWVSFGQPEGRKVGRAGRARSIGEQRWMRGKEQLKVLAAIEEQIAKMKSGVEVWSEGRQGRQKFSNEERTALREKFMKMSEERQQSIAVIEEQIAKLKGARQLRAEHKEFVDKLNAIRALAVKEKATETVASIEKLIAELQREFEDRLQKLGLGQRPSIVNIKR